MKYNDKWPHKTVRFICSSLMSFAFDLQCKGQTTVTAALSLEASDYN